MIRNVGRNKTGTVEVQKSLKVNKFCLQEQHFYCGTILAQQTIFVKI